MRQLVKINVNNPDPSKEIRKFSIALHFDSGPMIGGALKLDDGADEDGVIELLEMMIAMIRRSAVA